MIKNKIKDIALGIKYLNILQAENIIKENPKKINKKINTIFFMYSLLNKIFFLSKIRTQSSYSTY